MTKLTIELVPKTCWFANVRSEVSPAVWGVIKRKVYKKAQHRCEICNGKGSKWPVECHEVWKYKDGVQKLVRMIALCPDCHEVKHFGFAQINGHADRALKKLMAVNGWDKTEATEYVEKAFQIWEKRSCKEWDLDVSHLKKFGFKIKPTKEKSNFWGLK